MAEAAQTTIRAAVLSAAVLLVAGIPAQAGAPAVGVPAAGPVSSSEMTRVGPGKLKAFYRVGDYTEIPITAFRLDVLPVTNGDFLRFVRQNPQWQRGRVEHLYAEENYLSHWNGPLEFSPETDSLQPVTRVSWFAARAYCQSQGKRLPLEDEWEFAAATEATSNGNAEVERVIEWFRRPGTVPLPRVGQTPANRWGVHDLNAVVWEWVEDFGGSAVAADSREGRAEDPARFCGAGSMNVSDKADYVRFLRFGMRSSLQASYALGVLGFRCGADAGE